MQFSLHLGSSLDELYTIGKVGAGFDDNSGEAAAEAHSCPCVKK